MTPTNQQIAEHLKAIGNHIVELESHLLEVDFSVAQQYKLFASRVPTLTADEDAALRVAAQVCLDNGNRRKAVHTKFRQLVEEFGRI
jgi:hypothetical protein